MLLVIPNLTCNLNCFYCYEKKYRQVHKPEMKYDLEKVLEKMEEFKGMEMCLHGGEPLLMPKKDVRRLLLKMKELTGKSAIQTNGTLIDDEFIEIFKECSTSVGLSYDGPGELSEYRLHSFRKDPEIDEKIKKMINAGVSVSLIIVVSKANAGTKKRLEKLKNYLLKLNKLRIYGRLNPCCGAKEYELDEKRMVEVYLDLAQFCLKNNLPWSPFRDVVAALQGKPRVCTLSGCDPFSTPSAAELLGDGSVTNCMRVNQEYILLRHPIKYNTRDEILLQTPQEYGGCQGCQYWSACFGGCPSVAINNDWRNRTYLCYLWKALFNFYEKILKFVGLPVCLCGEEQQKEKNVCQSKYYKPSPNGRGGHQDHFDQGYRDHIDYMDHLDHLDESHNGGVRPALLLKETKEHLDTSHQDTHSDFPHIDWKDHLDHIDWRTI